MTWRTRMSGAMVIGSRSTPDSKRLTLATSAACSFGEKFLWMMPIPPSCAIAIARRASVTVSMAADTRGMLSSSLRVRRDFRETWRGRTREWAGRRRTSSKVSAFWITRMVNSAYKNALYASPSRASPPRFLGIQRQRPQDFQTVAITQGALGRNRFAGNSELHMRGGQSMAREQAACGNCLAGERAFRQLDAGNVLGFGQGVDHFNAHGG